jgi:type 1 glutamine amidotransferase
MLPMRSSIRPLLVVALAGLAAAAPGPRPAAPPATPAPSPSRILVMSKTAGFRHGSIDAGAEALRKLGAQHGFVVDVTADAAVFTPDRLKPYKVVVFNNTTGDILDRTQEAAFEAYIRNGGGFVGIHAATDTEYDWAWYGKLVGARFKGHGPVQPAQLVPADRDHPSTRHLPSLWPRRDEWYTFNDMVPDLHVLVRLKEPDGTARPIAWCHDFDGGRSWYTAGGHLPENFSEPLFVEHLLGGLRWAMGPD